MITNDNADRAGKYIVQIGGYKAFIPKPLPPDPPIKIDEELLQLHSQADIALGRLSGTSEILPNLDLFVAMYIHKEAVLSSQIEGTQASLIDVLAFEADAALPENPQDIEEVVNYIRALNYGLQRFDTLPLSLRLIREIDHILRNRRFVYTQYLALFATGDELQANFSISNDIEKNKTYSSPD